MEDTTGNVSCILLFFIEGMEAATDMICVNFQCPIAANECSFLLWKGSGQHFVYKTVDNFGVLATYSLDSCPSGYGFDCVME